MYKSCLEKQERIKALFNKCPDAEAKYRTIIDLGKKLPKLDPKHKQDINLIKGCQSIMHLHAELHDTVIHFAAESDALISSGLAAILIEVYHGETPETVLKCPPEYLETLGISASLTPSRANGLYSIHLKMKQEALKFLLNQHTNQ